MLLLGLLAIVQITFLPGYLLLRALRLNHGVLRTWVLSFALSLVINHFLVLGLVLLGAYRSPVLYGIFAVEALALAWPLRETWRQPLAALWRNGLAAARQALPPPLGTWQVTNGHATWQGRVQEAGLTAMWLVVLAYAGLELLRLGDTFVGWDAVWSWNKWALDWAAGQIPPLTLYYPQLLPTNGSLTYVFLHDHSVWLFFKGFQFLFCLLLLAALLDAYYQTRDFAWVVSAAGAYALLVALIRFRWLSNGYADVPVAFFACMPLYALVLARQCADPAQRRKFVLLGAVLAAGAALTKQMGLWIAGIYPLWAWLLLTPAGGMAIDRRQLRQLIATLAIAVAIVGLLVVPWYAFKYLQIRSGADVSNVWYLMTDPFLHAKRTLAERFLHAAGLASKYLPLPVAVCVALGIAAALRDAAQRWTLLLIVLPYYVVWSVAFSYEGRNLAMITALSGVALGHGIVRLLEGLGAWLPAEKPAMLALPAANALATHGGWWERVQLGHALLLLGVAAAGLNFVVPRDSLVARQLRLQRRVGVGDVDDDLYAYRAAHGIDGQIISNYCFLPWLPDLAPHYYAYSPHAFDPMGKKQAPEQDLQLFCAAFQRPEVRFAYVCLESTSPQIQAWLDAQVRDGAARLEREHTSAQIGVCRLYRRMPLSTSSARQSRDLARQRHTANAPAVR